MYYNLSQLLHTEDLKMGECSELDLEPHVILSVIVIVNNGCWMEGDDSKASVMGSDPCSHHPGAWNRPNKVQIISISFERK